MQQLAWKCHSGCDTVSESEINEYCSLCGECIIETTGGLCALTLCAKGLLNGPCSGAENGKCEVAPDRDCGWILIYDMKARVHAISVTDNQSAVMRPGSLAASIRLKQKGYEPIYQITCRDRIGKVPYEFINFDEPVHFCCER